MLRRILPLSLVVGMVLPQQFVNAQFSPVDVDLATGIRQVREGDFDAALITLDAVVGRLSVQPGQRKELAQAYTYLAIAYVGLAQREAAKSKLLEAWHADKSMTLSPKEFPPNIIELFEEAKKEGEDKARAEARPTSAMPKPAPSPATTKKGGGHTGVILLGVGVAAGIGVGVAVKGGASSTPPTTLTPPPATLADLSATVTSPQFNTNLNCTDNVSATITLMNKARGSVTVSGVRAENRVVSGRCTPGRCTTAI